MRFKFKTYMTLVALIYAMAGFSPAEAKRLVCDNPTTESGEWVAWWMDTADPCSEYEESLRAAPLSPKRDDSHSQRRSNSQFMKTGGPYLVAYVMESYEAPSPASVNCE